MLHKIIGLKYILTLIFFTWVLSTSVFSQEFIYYRGLVSVSAGVAVPAYDFGDFSSTSLTSNAKLGTNICVETSYLYSHHVGLSFMLNYSVFSVNTDKLVDSYFNASPAFTTVSAESGTFRDLSGLIGLWVDVPVNDYLSLSLKMLGGLRNVHKPSALINTTTIFSSVYYYETDARDLVVAFLFSGGTRIAISERLNLNLNAAYIGSELNFEYVRNDDAIIEKSHIGIVSLNAGVSYFF